MLLKITKEIGKSVFTLAASATTGLVAAVVYLGTQGFRCLTNNLSENISVDLSKLNYTAILQAVEAHKGNIDIPFNIELADTNVGACTTPLAIGAGLGAAAGGLYLTFNYAYQCAKRKQKSTGDDASRPLLRETFSPV